MYKLPVSTFLTLSLPIMVGFLRFLFKVRPKLIYFKYNVIVCTFLKKHENGICFFMNSRKIETLSRGLSALFIDRFLKKLGYQINRLDTRNPMNQVAMKYLNK